jgi:hypothetical protein
MEHSMKKQSIVMDESAEAIKDVYARVLQQDMD